MIPINIPENLEFRVSKHNQHIIELDISFMENWISKLEDAYYIDKVITFDYYQECVSKSIIALDELGRAIDTEFLEKYIGHVISPRNFHCMACDLANQNQMRKYEKLPEFKEILEHYLGIKYSMLVAYQERIRNECL